MNLTKGSLDLQTFADYADTFISDSFNGYDLPLFLSQSQLDRLTQIMTTQMHLQYFNDKGYEYIKYQ